MKRKKFYNFEKIFVFVLIFGAHFLIFGSVSNAQDIEAKIKITSLSPARIHIVGKFLNPKNNLESRSFSFLQSYADVSDLGARIENLKLFDEKGNALEVKKLMAGEFQTSQTVMYFAYEVKTEVPKVLPAAAHISWLSNDYGLLMLNDLLPLWENAPSVSAKIKFEIPNSWRVTTSETQIGENAFHVKDIESAIFLIGKNWRERTARTDWTVLNLSMAGEWQFSDDEALQMTTSILEEHRKIFREIPAAKTQVFLLPFPRTQISNERWRAETRGSTVVLLSGVLPHKSQALQRLHEQLRHELFHLWVPNSLALSGNYDWFYEGFTVYQALRTGVWMNQIRFEDYLNTLGQAYNLQQNQNASLIEISNRRWTGASGSVYAKGMIVAFLCDAALLRQSKGKRSLTDIFRQIYQKHSIPNLAQNGNTAIQSVLKSYPELRFIVQNYIEGKTKIDWQNELNTFGIEVAKNDFKTELKVMSKLSGQQKDLLDKLGYNQWRKLLQKTK